MELFYIIVSIATVIILIISLTFVGLMMRNGKKTQQFPPNVEQCPDRWIPDGSYCHFNGVNNGTYAFDGKFLKEGASKYEGTSTEQGNVVPFFVKGGTQELQNSTTIEPSSSKWTSTGVSSICAQNKWATKYGIQWSGISQLNNCS